MWNWTENQIKMVLIRHGATASNREHRYLGKTDESLDMIGMEEFREISERRRSVCESYEALCGNSGNSVSRNILY